MKRYLVKRGGCPAVRRCCQQKQTRSCTMSMVTMSPRKPTKMTKSMKRREKDKNAGGRSRSSACVLCIVTARCEEHSIRRSLTGVACIHVVTPQDSEQTPRGTMPTGIARTISATARVWRSRRRGGSCGGGQLENPIGLCPPKDASPGWSRSRSDDVHALDRV